MLTTNDLTHLLGFIPLLIRQPQTALSFQANFKQMMSHNPQFHDQDLLSCVKVPLRVKKIQNFSSVKAVPQNKTSSFQGIYSLMMEIFLQ